VPLKGRKDGGMGQLWWHELDEGEGGYDKFGGQKAVRRG
jgi:hypothetical protein